MRTEQLAESSRNVRSIQVILVHGINTDGSWEQDIKEVLKSFYNPIETHYDEYRRCGATKLVLEPIALLLGVAAIGFTVYSGLLELWSLWFWVAFVLIVFISVFTTGVRKSRALKSLRRQAGDSFLAMPHIIAHSFGTYLTRQMLQETPSAFVRRIIFVGCVLDRRTDWKTLIGKGIVAAVRNEWSTSDWVVSIAGLVSWLHAGMGTAGKGGFIDGHNVPDPRECCPDCISGNAKTDQDVHNVDCSALGHSDTFLVRSHAVYYWLPFLWNIEPAEYRELLTLCGRWVEAEERSDSSELQLLEGIFHKTRWQCFEGQTVYEKLAHIMRIECVNGGSQPPLNLAGLAVLAGRQFFLNVGYARRDDFGGSEFRMLNPSWAITGAARYMLNQI